MDHRCTPRRSPRVFAREVECVVVTAIVFDAVEHREELGVADRRFSRDEGLTREPVAIGDQAVHADTLYRSTRGQITAVAGWRVRHPAVAGHLIRDENE